MTSEKSKINLESLNRSKGNLKGKLTRMETFLKETSEADMPDKTELEVKIKTLDVLQQKLDSLRDEYYNLADATELAEIEKDLLETDDRIEKLEESTRSTTKKVLETNRNQSLERRKLIDHFQSQFLAVIQQGETELGKIKDAEEKMQKLLVQQQKHQQQVRIAHSQRVKALKNLSEEFCKGMNELEENHVEQYSVVHNELRKEMALLQKKILMETQQQEMMNVRKQLKQFFN